MIRVSSSHLEETEMHRVASDYPIIIVINYEPPESLLQVASVNVDIQAGALGGRSIISVVGV